MMSAAESELVAAIAAPLAETAGSGEDLRLDTEPRAIYSALRDARSEARAAERRAENDPASGAPDQAGWRIVERLAVDALTTRSKDVEIACWLAESLTRRLGLAGLAEGTDILGVLVSGFWHDGLFPNDDDDPRERLAAVTGLSGESRDGSLLQPLRRIVLFEMADGSPVAYWQYERSRAVQSLGEPPKGQKTAEVIAFADIEAGAKGHGRAMLLETGLEAIRAADAWRKLEAVLVGTVGDASAPSTGRVRDILAEIIKVAERHLPPGELGAATVGISELCGADIEPDGDVIVRGPVSKAASREALLDELLRIASAFRMAEPNSPLSYTLEEAVRRARLSWMDLLREMMPDLQPRATVLSGLGIRPPAE